MGGLDVSTLALIEEAGLVHFSNPPGIEFEEFDPIVDWLQKNLNKGDVVLIKGSHGLRMDRIASALEMRS